MTKASTRILLAKIALEGRDRGVKVLARVFHDASFEVMFEVFREGHVPVCEVADLVVDPFNDPNTLVDEEPEELF